MNVLCPRCSSGVAVPGDVGRAKCPGCGLDVDLTQAGTFPGPGAATIVRDFTGETFGRYRVLEIVGLGGMGVVYKALDQDSDQTVALKVLFYDYWDREEFVTRFQREALALQRLAHPNIVKILDNGQSDGIYYLVMEFVEGVNLAEYMRRGEMGVDETLRIMTEVCRAMSHAHQQGIVHRDLKPGNIMLANGTVKVLDFGLARITGGESKLTSLTRTDLAMGTLNYLSPEQRANAKTVDERSDIFSLGVIFYEMLTGQLPWGNYMPPSQIKQGLSRECDTIVDRSLSVDPDDRYPNIDSLIASIQDLTKKPRTGKKYLVLAGMALLVAFGGWLVLAERPFWKEWIPFTGEKPGQETGRPAIEKPIPAPEIANKEVPVQPDATVVAINEPDTKPEEQISQPAPIDIAKIPHAGKTVTAEPRAAMVKKTLAARPKSEVDKKSLSPTPKTRPTEQIQRSVSEAAPEANQMAPLVKQTDRGILYKEPSTDSIALAMNVLLDKYQVLKTRQPDKKGPRWLYIRTADGLTGWIPEPKKVK